MHRAASVATGALATLAIAGCDATDIASSGTDRVTPSVSVTIESKIGSGGSDSVSVRLPLKVHVTATDNTSLGSVVTRVFADTVLVQKDSAAGSGASFDKVLTFSLIGVRPGAQVTVLTHATDGAGNGSDSQTSAVAFDPNVPRLAFVQPDGAVIVGGTYNFRLAVADSTGLSKAGYKATGAGVNKSDSTLFPVPLPTHDTVTYSIPITSSAVVGSIFTVTPFAENASGLRITGAPINVRVQAAGADVVPPLVFQTVPPRMETPDSLDITARDSDGLIRIVGYIAKDQAGNIVFRSADTLTSPSQQVTRRKAFNAPVSLRGQTLFITAFATDLAGHTGYAAPTGSTLPVATDDVAKRDPTVYAYGLTFGMPAGSLGADIAVDTLRNTVYVSNINKNELEAWTYGPSLTALPPVSVGAMPWGMVIDNSGSLLLVANSGGTNISKVNLVARAEDGRIKTANQYLYNVSYSKDQNSGGFKFDVVGPIDYSDRPQYIAQSASGALYYSTRPTPTATPGTLRRIDNFLDERTEPRQIWQYGTVSRGHYVVLNSDAVDVIKGQNGVPDSIIVCDHTPGDSPTSATCVQDATMEGAVAALRSAPVNGDVEAVKDLDITSLALPDTNFVAVGADRRRVAFGEAHTANTAGRVLLVFDPSGTPAGGEQYSAPIEVADLTNNASDQVFGIAINNNSTNFAVHGVETFFSDSSLRLQGKFATFNTGAGVAFHPGNIDENTSDQLARVAFVASGDMSIQIVDSYSYRLRGRIPLRMNLYGTLRAVLPTQAERASDPNLAVKLFGLTAQGLVVIDVRKTDIDNLR
jgi:hypothetical protein